MEIIVKKMERSWRVTREGDEYSSFSIFEDEEGFSVPLGDFNNYYPSSDRARSDWD